jgi:hypothetical protein
MAFDDSEHQKSRERISRSVAEHHETWVKLQGSVEGPQTQQEIDAYYLERHERLKAGDPTWIALNFDSDGRAWNFYALGREGVRVVFTEDFVRFEGYVGREGEIGSGLTSLTSAVAFVEEHDLAV